MADKITEIFALTLNIPEQSITDATSPENTAAWDSLANMMLIAAIEETYGIELSTSEIETMRSVGAVRAVLDKRHSAKV